MQAAGALVVRSGGNGELPPAGLVVALHRYAKLLHQPKRDCDVRFGNQLALDIDGQGMPSQRRSHQQGG